jgi:hypothetical protein
LPPGTLDDRPRLDVVRPFLLRKVEAQVMPFDLFYFFEPHRDEFLKNTFRSAFYYGSVVLGAPLFVYGLWRWARSPLSLPVLGLWWAGVIAAFMLARIPAWPWYPLILAPLPAVLMAGAFDGPLRRAWMERALLGWRIAYVAAMLGLTVATGAWLTGRGGAAGDYGVAYRIKEAQAQAVVARLQSGEPPVSDPSKPSAKADNSSLTCAALPIEVNWLVNFIDPSHPAIPPGLRLCDGWIEEDGRLVYQWAVRLE